MSDRGSAAATLDLASLSQEPGMPGLTCSAGAYLAEAAAVCFDHCGHHGEFDLSVEGDVRLSCRMCRPTVEPRTRRTHADLQEATEHGACAVAILLTREIGEGQVLERSAKGTGFDYWIGHDGSVPFRLRARLEVSGILRGAMSEVDERLKAKCRQTEQSDTMRLDALVIVVEFSRPLAKVAKR